MLAALLCKFQRTGGAGKLTSLYKGAKLRVWSKNSIQRATDSVQKKRVSHYRVKSKERVKKILKFPILPF